MRILHVTDGFRPRLGGIEIFVEDLADRQAAAGHDVSVLTATPSEQDLETAPIEVLRTPPTGLHPLVPPSARAATADGRFDVVHAHLSVVSPFATAVARLADEAGIPTVVTVHSMWRSRRSVVRVVRTLAGWDRSGVTWTAVSRAAATDMAAILERGTSVHVVPNAVDVAWWRSGSRTHPTGGPVTLVSVMRLAGRKRPLALLGIVDAVRAAVPDGCGVRLLVIGDGPLTHRMQAEVERRRLGRTVTLLGRLTREEIRGVYGAADVFVSPAYQESFGIAALEARAAGLPVVAMSQGGVGEFIGHGVEGLLCDDDDAMVHALAALVADAGLRSELAGHNLAHSPRQDWPGTLAAFDDVYQQARLRTALVQDRLTSGTRP